MHYTHHTHLGSFTTDTIPPTPFHTLNGNLLIEKYEGSCESRNFLVLESNLSPDLIQDEKKKETFVSILTISLFNW